MTLNRMWKLWLLASLSFAAPLWGQNSTNITCTTQTGPGGAVVCSLKLTLGSGVSVPDGNIGVAVTPNGAAPMLTSGQLTFTPAVTGLNSSTGVPATNNAIAVYWVSLSPALTGPGTTTLGTIGFNLPAGATANQTYAVTITGASADDGQGHTITITPGAAQSVTVVGTLTITSPASGATLPAATVGAAYSTTIMTSGGTTPYTFTLSGLPGQFSINSSGVISGTPAAAATYTNSVGVTVKDSSAQQQTASATYSLTVNPAPSISPSSGSALPTGTKNAAYPGQTFTVTGGTAPYTWAVTSANLPTGMNLTTNSPSSTASLGGTPTTVANAITVTVQVTDANGASTSGNYSLTVNGPLTLNTTTLPPATVNAAYTTTLSAGGGTPPYTWSVPANSLPNGLSLNTATGVISGTPTTTTGSPFSIAVTVTDAAHSSVTSSPSLSLTVNPALVITAPASLPNGTTGANYLAAGNPITATATGGSSSGYTWSISGLAGVTIGSSTGTLSGKPTAAGTTNVTITVTDSNGVQTSKTYNNIVIAAGPSISAPASLTAATVGAAYSATITAINGTSPFTWSISGFPGGFTITPNSPSNTATITGTAGSPSGPTTVMVTVTDANTAQGVMQYSFTVYAAPAVSISGSLPVATSGAAYTSPNGIINITGGAPPLTVTTTPALPQGLTISSTGIISGTPASLGNSPTTVTFTVTAKDANNVSATSGNVSLTVNPALVITAPNSLPVGVPSVVYAQQTFTATGGSGAGYTWTATNLPTGLTLTSAGVLSGTPGPNAAGSYNANISVTDSNSVKTTRIYNLVIAPPLSISGPTTLPPATVNVNYPATAISATGGSGTYTSWTATGLPPGLVIGANTGVITGTPSNNSGSPYAVTVTVTDSFGTHASMNYSLQVGALPLQIITGILPQGIVNVPYPITFLQVQGGIGSYSYSVTGLPPGLNVDNNGDISGTPTTATGSPFSVKLTVTDAAGNQVSRTYTLVVNGTLTIASPSTLPAASLNASYPATAIVAGGGLAPYTFTATGLPAGLSIAQATGVISGAPTTSTGSPYSVTVTVTDATGKTFSMNYSLTVNAPLTISGPAALPAGTVSTAYTATTITATGGTGTYTWSATGLPVGMLIATQSGVISGTPTTATGSPFPVVVTVTDSAGNTAVKNYSLVINSTLGLPTITNVYNSAGGESTITPNGYASIAGTNFTAASFTDTWGNSIVNGNLPTNLDGVKVSIGGTPVYVEYVSATQINVLLGNVGLGQEAVVVTTAAGSSTAFNVTVQQYSPAIFVEPNSSSQPVATHLDYSLALAPGTIPGLTTVAAKPGENIVLWCTGFGPTTPAYPVGTAVPATPAFVTSSSVTVSLNSAPATVYQNIAVLTASLAGTYQISFTVPASLANGTYPLTATINGQTTNTVQLVVHN